MISALIASDFHFPHADPLAVEALLVRAASEAFSGVVLNGDVLDGKDFLTEALAFRAFAKALRARSAAPVYVVWGNHDAASPAGRSAVAALFTETLGASAQPTEALSVPPFTFLHGSLHDDFYTKSTAAGLPAESDSVLVVGHAHRAQAFHWGKAAVYGLPCMALRGVPGAQLGYGVARFGRGFRSFETAIVQSTDPAP